MMSHMTTPQHATEAQNVLLFLGGRKALGVSSGAPVSYSALVRGGLPHRALLAVTNELLFSLQDIQANLKLSRRTLLRRKAGRLTPTESERLLRLARIAAHAVHVFGDRETALRWLTRSNRALEGDIPVSLLDTEPGGEEVRELLDQIRYGVYR